MSEPMMKAAVTSGGALEIKQVARPKPKANEVLVKLAYCGLNRADLMHTARPAGSPPSVPGMDWCGEVIEVGAEVENVKPGERVMCSGFGPGGYAEYAVTDWGRVLPAPASLSDEQAATLMLALQTMHDALITNGRMAAGDAVLIQGASAGVGLMGLKIAKLKGAKFVVGSSRNAAHRARFAEFGADLAIDTGNDIWPEEVLQATGGKGVDVVVDQVSGKTVAQSMKACATLARIVNVGRLGGNAAEIDFGVHALKRINFIGVTFRSRSIDEVRELTRRMQGDLWGDVAAGQLLLPIDRVFALDEAEAAQSLMRANGHFGKIVLKM